MHYDPDNNYFFVNGKEIFEFKVDNKNASFPTQFWLRESSNGFKLTELWEVSLSGNVHGLSVDYNSIDKCGILNIHEYLWTKNNIKQCSGWLMSY